MCDYSYKISSDLGKDLDRVKVFEVLLKQLQIYKKEKKKIQRYNFYGDVYFDE